MTARRFDRMPSEHRPAAPCLVITCEHGGNDIPRPYRRLFTSPQAQAALESHRGYDPGTLELARAFAESLNAPLFFSTVSRLLIELNRTLGHRQLFSEWSRQLSGPEREQLIDEYYLPYRRRIESHVRGQAALLPVLHLSVHSFTSVWKGTVRQTEIGLLFDPSRIREREFCREWRDSIGIQLPGRVVHFNRPYRGTSDGLTVALRRAFRDDQYAGMELEVNQKLVADPVAWDELKNKLTAALRHVLSASPVPAG
jgi:predicted N-formylglutamate amidohydrolase